MTGQLDLFRDCAAPLGRAIEIDRDTPVPEEESRRTQLAELPPGEWEDLFEPPEAA